MTQPPNQSNSVHGSPTPNIEASSRSPETSPAGAEVKPTPQPQPEGQIKNVTDPSFRQRKNLASELTYDPIATLNFPGRNIYVKPVKNLRPRHISPLPVKGSLSLPIRGEQIFDVSGDVQRQMEKRLSTLMGIYETKPKPSAVPGERVQPAESPVQPSKDEALPQVGQVATSPTQIQPHPPIPQATPAAPPKIQVPAATQAPPQPAPPKLATQLPQQAPPKPSPPSVVSKKTPAAAVQAGSKTPPNVGADQERNLISWQIVSGKDSLQSKFIADSATRVKNLTAESQRLKEQINTLRKEVVENEQMLSSTGAYKVLTRIDSLNGSLSNIADAADVLEKVLSDHTKTLTQIEKRDEELVKELEELNEQLSSIRQVTPAKKVHRARKKRAATALDKTEEKKKTEAKKPPPTDAASTRSISEVQKEILKKAEEPEKSPTPVAVEVKTDEDIKKLKEALETAKVKIATSPTLAGFGLLPEADREEMIHKLQNLKNETEIMRQYSDIKKAQEKQRIFDELNSVLTEFGKKAEKPKEVKEQAPKITAPVMTGPELTPQQKAQAIVEIKRLEEQAKAKPPTPQKAVVSPRPAVGRMAPTLTTVPNVVSGNIKDRAGMLLSDVVILVKDEAGSPVRALKSNKIGQFAISTPLPNGTYTIELEKEGLAFDNVQITLEGKVLAPIEIRAR